MVVRSVAPPVGAPSIWVVGALAICAPTCTVLALSKSPRGAALGTSDVRIVTSPAACIASARACQNDPTSG